MALAVVLGGCKEERQPAPPPPEPKSSSRASSNPPEDFKIFLRPDVDDKTIIEQLRASAKAVEGSLSVAIGPAKCRRVSFRDTEPPTLRGQGLSLRVREQRGDECEPKSGRLAMSFNAAAPSEAAALARRESMAVSSEVAERNRKNRYKVRHVMQDTPRDIWLVGATVRRLKRAPQTLADVRNLFPALQSVANEPIALVPVAGRHVFEQNHDVGHVQLEKQRARIELATISKDVDGSVGTAIAREISVELEHCCSQGASAFARHAGKAFGDNRLPIVAREDLLY